MNKLWYILAIFFLVGCEDKFPDPGSHATSASDYVDLYFYNYDSLENDPVKINDVFIDGDLLVINLSYSGGCKDHVINLIRDNPWCGTPPLPPPTFAIRHDANDDLCEAWITKTFKFDISKVQEGNESPLKIIFQANEYGNDFFFTELTYIYE